MSTYLRLGNYNVPGHGLQVTGDLEIRTEDLSGETSGTDRVNKGVKPKSLTVSLSIRFGEEQDLRGLVRVAEAREGAGGDLVVHTIVNRTANAAGIRQVQFTDHFRWKEKEDVRAWSVSFTLREYLSVPERVEQREEPAAKVKQASDSAQLVQDAEGTADTTGETLTNFEKLLSKVDGALK